MKSNYTTTALVIVMLFSWHLGNAQVHPCTGGGSYSTDGDEVACIGQAPCCLVWNACNGPYSPCPNYDPDYSGTGGCDLSCAPIDSGILFLLLGGGLFGAFMISRKRDRELAVQHLNE